MLFNAGTSGSSDAVQTVYANLTKIYLNRVYSVCLSKADDHHQMTFVVDTKES